MLAPELVEEVAAWAAEARLDSPAYLLVPAALHAGVARLRRELPARISYATKANAHPRVLAELAPLVDEFNVTNLSHLDALAALGVAPERIVFLHPVCAPATVQAVADRGIGRFVVDDARGLRLLQELGPAGGGIRVTLRLRPPDPGGSERSLVRFGNTAEVLPELARQAVDAGFELEALSFFVGMAGAGMAEALPFRRGIEALAQLHERLERHGIRLPAVNIGGGFPGSRRRFHLRHADLFARIAQALEKSFGPEVGVVCEPGRFLAEPSMAILTRVLADRTIAGRRMVHLDASAYGGLFESSFIEPGSGPEIGVGRADRPAVPAEVLGPVMDSFDVVERRASLPPLEEGELLLLPNVGAYSWEYTTRTEGIGPPAVVDGPGRIVTELAAAWHD